ncbi:hypothetical protein [Ideonella sp. A 288]|uniref:hypothetical protein n=1 Tax=Ideonella sp. A 288 TaxID=1962181 RepID=UPI000B4AD2A7|nr:hypothetical protein [Ideonella sp. A 288]
MLRFGESIRLTELDRELFARVAASEWDAPTSVGDYNRRLELATKMWSGGTSPGALLLAQMARDLMLDPADPADVLGNRPIGPTLSS